MKNIVSLTVLILILFGISSSSFADSQKTLSTSPQPNTNVIATTPGASTSNPAGNTVNVTPQPATPGTNTPITVTPQTRSTQAPVASPTTTAGFFKSTWAAIVMIIIVLALVIAYFYEPRRTR